MAAPAPISLIPEKIGRLAAGIAAGGLNVTRAFVDRWAGSPETALVGYLRSALCNFRLTFTRSSSKTILFVFRQEGPVKVVFDATVSFEINSSSDLSPWIPPALSDVGVVLVLPSFLVGVPTRQQLDRFAFGADSTAANTLLLALGPDRSDILAVMNPEAGEDALIRYSPGGNPGPIEPAAARYSLRWVLSFIRTLGSWMESDLSASASRPAVVSQDEESVSGVLYYLLQAFVNASQELSAGAAEAARLPDIFQKTYEVNGYQADLKLRLRPDGKLSDAEDFETTQLTLRLRVRDGEPRIAEITAIPNELAVSGSLAASFFACLQFGVDEETWVSLLGVDRVFVGPFFHTAQDYAVFRISRDEFADTDVVILRGFLKGVVTTVVLTARFTVDMKKDAPEVQLPRQDSIQILAIAPDEGTATVGFGAVSFLLQYLVNLRRWIGGLG